MELFLKSGRTITIEWIPFRLSATLPDFDLLEITKTTIEIVWTIPKTLDLGVTVVSTLGILI